MGRPSDFTQKFADDFCSRLAAGESVRTICDTEGMPNATTVFAWLHKNAEFHKQYLRAKQLSLLVLAEDLVHISDTPIEGTKTKDGPKGLEVITGDMTEHRKLQIDTRKWYLSKLAPKVFGDRSTVDVNLNDKTVTRLAAGRKRAGG